MRVFCSLLFFLPFIVLAQQENNEVRFEKDISWERVKAKAKAEGKYIFVDCFTTWCGPCKYMDREVYPNRKVGAIMNEQFISVKVQMDTSKVDNENVKKWYADARDISNEYKINAFPTFLFISPSGEIVHKDMGAKRADDFIALAKTALDPKMQYYTLLSDYKKGKKTYAVMPYLARTAQRLKENEVADAVAKDYIDNYLFGLKESELFTKDNIEFISSFIRSFDDKGFKLFFSHQAKLDSLMGQKDYSQKVIDRTIFQKEIFPDFKKADKENGTPDWSTIVKSITKKFNGLYADRTVTNAQVVWYRYKEQWPQYLKSGKQQVEKYEVSDPDLNNIVWYGIFLHSDKKADINTGIKWMEEMIKRNDSFPDAYDTYANLLYKAGRKKEAIAVQEKAIKMAPNSKEMAENLKKMKNGEVTWVELGSKKQKK